MLIFQFYSLCKFTSCSTLRTNQSNTLKYKKYFNTLIKMINLGPKMAL